MKNSTKKKLSFYAKEITGEILMTLEGLGQLIPYPFETKYDHIRRLRDYERGKITRGFYDLRKQGMVKKVKVKDKVYYGITDLGRIRALRYSYFNKPKSEKKNGLATIIIFDIPEVKKKARNFLRRMLVENDFMMLQKSVFIGRMEVDTDFRKILKELNIEQNVTILEGRILFS